MNRREIEDVLRNSAAPESSKLQSLLSAVSDIAECDGIVKITIDATTLTADSKVQIEAAIREKLNRIPQIRTLNVTSIVRGGAAQELPTLQSSPPRTPPPQSRPHGHPAADKAPIAGVTNIIAVASGKGGVGKSTIAVNLALALKNRGLRVGVCDVDIYGPSLPLMLGLKQRPYANAEKKLVPLEKYGLKVMSIGFLLEDDTPVIWRGPMVMQMVRQFLREVDWGELDYLVLDLPPGTGDAQLTLVQTIPLSGAVIVTTPNDIALLDARRGLAMFREVSVPVLGIVENMSSFVCPKCHHETAIFDSGGGRRTADELDVPFLGDIPIDPLIRQGGDTGQPVVEVDAKSSQALAFDRVAESILERLGNKTKSKGFVSSLLSRL